MSSCQDFVSELISVKELAASLSQQIDAFSNSHDSVDVLRLDKISQLKGIYDSKKETIQGVADIQMTFRAEDLLDAPAESLTKEDEVYILKYLMKKTNLKKGFSNKDLTFLYQIKSALKSPFFDGPRYLIENIVAERDIKSDIASVTGFAREEIITTFEELMLAKGKLKVYYGDLIFESVGSIGELELPEMIIGSLDLSSFLSADGITMPKIVRGMFTMNGVKTVNDLEMPKEVSDGVYFGNLEFVGRLVLPEVVGRILYLASLKTAKGVVFPKKVGGDIQLRGLENIDYLHLPEEVGGAIYLRDIPLNQIQKIQDRYPNLHFIF